MVPILWSAWSLVWLSAMFLASDPHRRIKTPDGRRMRELAKRCAARGDLQQSIGFGDLGAIRGIFKQHSVARALSKCARGLDIARQQQRLCANAPDEGLNAHVVISLHVIELIHGVIAGFP